jgi:hypothetical protein
MLILLLLKINYFANLLPVFPVLFTIGLDLPVEALEPFSDPLSLSDFPIVTGTGTTANPPNPARPLLLLFLIAKTA